MKRIIAILISILIIQGIQAQETYYWYNGNQIKINTVSNRMFVLVHNANDTVIVKSQITKEGYYADSFKKVIASAIPNKSSMIDTNYWTIVDVTNNQSVLPDFNIDYFAPSFLTQDSIVIGLSHLFYVRLNSLDDIELLEKM